MYTVSGKKEATVFLDTTLTNLDGFVIFSTNHPEDSHYCKNWKFIPNITTSQCSDDV